MRYRTWSRRKGGRHIPQPEFLHLACRGLRNLAKDDVARTLVGGQMLAAPGDHIVDGKRGPRGNFDESARGFTPFFIRLGNDGTKRYSRMLEEHFFHFDR